MATLFDSMPGVRMPVGEVMDTLAHMWDAVADGDDKPVSDFRASQLNLILHFGLKTSEEEASTLFGDAIRFAQRYPCRIIVLCPEGRQASDMDELEGKLFSQCYIGSENLRSMCCCEALMLGYPTREASYLDNMVSIWLENDLPTYHWFNRVPAERIRETHLSFIKSCKRIIYDSSVEEDGFREAVPWPEGAVVRDLAVARMLPVRQSIGQFLSGYEPSVLIDGLQSVVVAHQPGLDGECSHLLGWQRRALDECRDRNPGSKAEIGYSCRELDAADALQFGVEWQYSDKRYFNWALNREKAVATVDADLGKGRITFPAPLRLLSPDQSLAEAMFFE